MGTTPGQSDVTLPPGQWLARSEVARLLGVSGTRIDKMAIERKLPYLETPLGRLYPAEAVDAFKTQRDALRAAAQRNQHNNEDGE